MKRCFVEDVNGEWQGSAHSFSGGFSAGPNRIIIGPEGEIYAGHIGNGDVQNWGWRGAKCGLQKMVPNGEVAFEILAVRSRKNGMELEFTLPVDPAPALIKDNFLVRRYEMVPTNGNWPGGVYGGGHKQYNSQVIISSVALSEDHKRVFLEIDMESQVYRQGIFRKNTVIDIRTGLDENGKSVLTSDGIPARTPAAWYTLNSIDSSEAFDVRGCTDPGYEEYNAAATYDDGSCRTAVISFCTGGLEYATVRGGNFLQVNIRKEGKHTIKVFAMDGKTIALRKGVGVRKYIFTHPSLSGIYLVRVNMPGGSLQRKIMIF
jgi:hypothetical protein